MLSCKNCQTPNGLDSTFCKRCGAAISEADLTEAKARLEKLVEEGNTLFNAGRTDEALAIADAAVVENPSSTSAWSLRLLCHERRGEIAAALECADRLVELNPDSDFDKIRRATLRQKLETDLHVPPAPDRKLALIGGAAAIVLVLCVGAIVARMSNNTSKSSTAMVNRSTVPNANDYYPQTATVLSQGPQVSNSAPSASNTPAENHSTASQPESNEPSNVGSHVGSIHAPKLTVPPEGGGLPLPTNSGDPVVVSPLHPDVTGLNSGTSVTPESNVSTPKTNTHSIDPAPPGPGTDPAPPTNAAPKQEDPGTIEINVRHSGSGSARPSMNGGGETSVSGNGVEALTRAGAQQYQIGNYAGAARSYEQAIRGGGDAITLNRRLAQSLQAMGRSGEAADAYRKCINAIDNALAAGRGNKESLTSTRDLCQQALKVLPGN